MSPDQPTPDFDLSLSPSPALREGLAQIRWLRLAATHQALGDLKLKPFKGALWRSVLGMCLKQVSPAAYASLFEPVASNGRSDPTWCLTPPLIPDTCVPAGALLDSAITLFGPAMVHAPACVGALEAFERHGVGYDHDYVPLRLVSVRANTLAGAADWRSPDSVVNALDVFAAGAIETRGAAAHGVEVCFVSPLRLISDNQDVTGPPPFEILLRRTLGQIIKLAPLNLPQRLFARGEHPAWIAASRQVGMLACAIGPEGDAAKFSGRQNAVYPLKGLVGAVRYAPSAVSAMPWLRIAEWVQLGANTHHGFGVVAVRVHAGA